ncbi:hypothetical protein AOZ06_39875 [Kibdelosporangium phytohabitans]|uniref:Glycoside hydrolase n=1 Tax=Kibdelosporangium phytohabitans TaxID=860235 RepID=A0A0N9IBZ2_9PSEU|nr:hypothetical protein AOZ06_39875 [Kibdelosporangium phytohabitans]
MYLPIAEVACVPARARVFEQGWQSWSPTGTYRGDATSPRPSSAQIAASCFRFDRPMPESGFQGEGLVVIDPGDGGPVRSWSAVDHSAEVPSIRVQALGDRLVVSSLGTVRETEHADLPRALVAWAEEVAADGGVTAVRPLGPGWSSWYGHWNKVTEQDIADTLVHAERLELPLEIIQLDDGYQSAIGDWLDIRPGFGSLDGVTKRVAGTGRRAGIWLTPFFVAADSRVATEHPDWLVRGTPAMREWDRDIAVLDVTHPGAAEHLGGVFRSLVATGFSFFKIDYIYAGAHPGQRHADVSGHDAYLAGMRIIREAVGPDSTVLGCGAPMLPSVGLVDAMRVSPDTAIVVEPKSGDVSQPSQLGARLAGAAREFMHGRLWVNDPDCLLVSPRVEDRAGWADHVASSGGWRCSSDRLADLDEWGVARTRELLTPTTGPA